MCWGTQYQQVRCFLNDGRKTAENVFHTYTDAWTRIFGPPEVLVCDPGTEFQGHFADNVNGSGTVVFPTDARAPWQNGKTERAGGLWKDQLWLATREAVPTSLDEWKALGQYCSSVKNNTYDRSGATPNTRVFGTNMRIPGSLGSSDTIDPALLSSCPLKDLHRAAELRKYAQVAFAKMAVRESKERHMHVTKFQLTFTTDSTSLFGGRVESLEVIGKGPAS